MSERLKEYPKALFSIFSVSFPRLVADGCSATVVYTALPHLALIGTYLDATREWKEIPCIFFLPFSLTSKKFKIQLDQSWSQNSFSQKSFFPIPAQLSRSVGGGREPRRFLVSFSAKSISLRGVLDGLPLFAGCPTRLSWKLPENV